MAGRRTASAYGVFPDQTFRQSEPRLIACGCRLFRTSEFWPPLIYQVIHDPRCICCAAGYDREDLEHNPAVVVSVIRRKQLQRRRHCTALSLQHRH